MSRTIEIPDVPEEVVAALELRAKAEGYADMTESLREVLHRESERKLGILDAARLAFGGEPFDMTEEEIEAEVDQAVAEVRAEMHAERETERKVQLAKSA